MSFLKRNSKKILNTPNLTKSLRDKGFNQYDLARRYITNFKEIGVAVKSDLRNDDKNHSLNTKVGCYGDIIVSDFGFKIGLTIYQYVALKYFGEGRRNYILGLDKIRHDFGLEDLYQPIISTKTKEDIFSSSPLKFGKEIKISLPTKIEIKRQRLNEKVHWSNDDIVYWKQYGISISKLESKGIAPLECFWVTNYAKDGHRIKYDTSNKLAYVYPFHLNSIGDRMYKIYLPYGLDGKGNYKWFGNTNKSAIQNIHNIPREGGKLLIIQSSYKDIMCMEEMDSSLYSLATNAEGIWFEVKAWKYLSEHWEKIVIFGNNDFNKVPNPGLEFARKHSLEYSIPFIVLPDNTSSDISDYYAKYGEYSAKHMLEKVLRNIDYLF